MKKIYISVSLLASVALCNHAAAQTTITAAALPQVGFIYNMISDTNMSDRPTFTVTAGSSTAQTWDYSALFNNIYSDPTAFVTPAGNPGASSFPSANMAANQNGSWAYFSSTASGLFVEGADALIMPPTTTAIVSYTPYETLIPVPYTYSNTTNNLYAATFTMTYSGNTLQIRHHANRTITADAFGSLTTPVGTYSNTLRLKTFESTIDSVFIFQVGSWIYSNQKQTDSTTAFTWMQNTQDAKLLEIDLSKTNAVTKAQYLQSLTFAGIHQLGVQNSELTIYPNPAKDEINLTISQFDHSKTNSVEVYNTIGECVHHQTITSSNSQINVSNLAEGVYNISIISGEAMINKRLVIVK